jgi:dTDP-D-glucose 4,6-dehydratase
VIGIGPLGRSRILLRQRPDMAIYRWTEQTFEGEPLTIYGGGRQLRDYH